MLNCKGKKGEARAIYKSKFDKMKARVKELPYKNKEVIAAVFADGKEYRINGCEGMNKVPESVRIIGKDGDMYKVVWGNSKVCSEVSREELSNKLDIYFDVKCNAQHGQAVDNHEVAEESHEEDR